MLLQPCITVTGNAANCCPCMLRPTCPAAGCRGRAGGLLGGCSLGPSDTAYVLSGGRPRWRAVCDTSSSSTTTWCPNSTLVLTEELKKWEQDFSQRVHSTPHTSCLQSPHAPATHKAMLPIPAPTSLCPLPSLPPMPPSPYTSNSPAALPDCAPVQRLTRRQVLASKLRARVGRSTPPSRARWSRASSRASRHLAASAACGVLISRRLLSLRASGRHSRMSPLPFGSSCMMPM
jgi:hypothetical protein